MVLICYYVEIHVLERLNKINGNVTALMVTHFKSPVSHKTNCNIKQILCLNFFSLFITYAINLSA